MLKRQPHSSLWQELKRRNVVRVGVAYTVVCWLLLQVLDVVAPILQLPNWIARAVLLAIVAGFPVALILAWIYELTPDGVKREKDVDRSKSIIRQTRRRLDYLIVSVMLVAIVVLLADKIRSPGSNSGIRSIAVLPFANMSADESNGHFSDGLADTLLQKLAQVEDLRVAARTSSFQFRGKNLDIATIGDTLKVKTVLEGSVQRYQNKIRITAQLISVEDGYHLWSGTFDRDLDNIFAIQDEIASEVVSALKIKLFGESALRLTEHETENVEALSQFMLGRNQMSEFSFSSLDKAEQYFMKATELDPDYALAFAMLARVYMDKWSTGAMSEEMMIDKGKAAATRALLLDAKLSQAHAAYGSLEYLSGNLKAAETSLRKAVELGPNDTFALLDFGDYLRSERRPEEAVDVYRKMRALDPLSTEGLHRLASALIGISRFDEASTATNRLREINPDAPTGYYLEAIVQERQGRWAEAIKWYSKASTVDPEDPEIPIYVGDLYLDLGLIDHAQAWYAKGLAIDAEQPFAESAQLVLPYYLPSGRSESLLIARALLSRGIENRGGSRDFALRVLADEALVSGDFSEIEKWNREFFPDLFTDAPDIAQYDPGQVVAVAAIMLRSGEEDRAKELLQEALARLIKFESIYGRPRITKIEVYTLLGDKARALAELRKMVDQGWYRTLWRFQLLFEEKLAGLRDEPQFKILIKQIEAHAMEQRRLLEASK